MKFPSKIKHRTGIYKITNVKTGTVYIGQASVNFTQRWNGHINSLNKNKHGNVYLQRAWNKYGSDSFTFSIEEYILASNDKEEFHERLNIAERKTLLLYPNHYNLMEAGKSGMISSESTKEKRSKIFKQHWENPEYQAKQSASRKNTWKDPEIRKSRIENAKKAFQTPEFKKKKSEVTKKALGTPEYREQASKRFKEIWKDPDRKASKSKKQKEFYTNPENKLTHSMRMKEWWAARKKVSQPKKLNACQSKSLKEFYTNPENKLAHRKRMKEWWAARKGKQQEKN